MNNGVQNNPLTQPQIPIQWGLWPFSIGGDMRFTGVKLDTFVARVYTNKVKHCKEQHIEFNLTLTQVKNMLRAKRCQYTGVELTHCIAGEPQTLTDVTIDRIDNSKGYVTGNVIACSKAANSFKGVIENPSNAINMKQFLKMAKKLDKIL